MMYELDFVNKYRLFKVIEGEEVYIDELKSLGWAAALAHKTFDESRSAEPEVRKIIIKDLRGRTLKVIDKV